MADRTVSVALVAHVRGYKGPIEDAAKATRKLDDDIDNLNKKTVRIGTDFDAAGRQVAKFGDQVHRTASQDNRSRFAKSGLDAGTSFGLSLGKGATKGIADTIVGLPKSIPAELKLVGAALGVGIGAAAAPLLGAALSAGVLGGAGLAAVAGGLALAIQDERVAAAGQKLASDIGEDLMMAGRVFVNPTLDGIDRIRRGWKSVGPDVAGSLAAASKYVGPLVDGLAGAAERAMPALRKAIEAAGPVITQLADGLKATGTEVGHFFDEISGHGNEAASAIETSFMLINGAISATTTVVGALSSAWESYTGTLGTLTGGLEDYFAGVPVVSTYFQDLNNIAERLNATANGKELATYATYFGPLATGAQSVALNYAAASREGIMLTSSMTAGVTAAGGLTEAFNILSGTAQSVRQTQAAFQAAIDAVTKSVKDNGATLDLNSEKGRANNNVLMALVKSSEAQAQAAYKSAEASGGAAAAQRAGVASFNAGRAAIEAAGRAMGLSAAQASQLANELFSIPASWQRTYTSTFTTVYRTNGTPATGNSRYPGINSADGNVIEAYASGGMRERHVAQMARAGAMRLWAEPETGGESYIPHAPSKRTGAVDVLQRTNAILGNPLSGGSYAPTFQVTVNAGMGADGRGVGAQVVEVLKQYERANGTNWRR